MSFFLFFCYKLLLLFAAKPLHNYYLQFEACLRFTHSRGWLCFAFTWICEFCVYVFLRHQPHVRERSSGVFFFRFKSMMGSCLDTTWSEPSYELLKMSRADKKNCLIGILGQTFHFIPDKSRLDLCLLCFFLPHIYNATTMSPWIKSKSVIDAKTTNQTDVLVLGRNYLWTGDIIILNYKC